MQFDIVIGSSYQGRARWIMCMTSSLKELLVSKKPRETSGPRSANRFDFQKSWALCRLLELHKQHTDYLIVFDYHDDVLVLDSSSEPSRVDFYQIKTASKYWTKNDLIARAKGATERKSSILGKMVRNKLDFPNHTGNLTFVSNQGFKLSVKGRASSFVEDVCLKQLDAKELKSILKALREEHSLAVDPDCADCTHLTVTQLSVGDHSDHAMGKLTRFIEELYPNQRVPFPAVYKALCDEIKRKASVELCPKDFAQICGDRSISRENFAAFLEDVRPTAESDDLLNDAMDRFLHEGMGFDATHQIRVSWRRYEVERMNQEDSVIRRARNAISRVIKQRREEGEMPDRLVDAIEEIKGRVARETKVLLTVRSEHYLTAMILMAIYGF